MAQPPADDLAAPGRPATLTPREREAVSLVSTGLSHDDSAERLFVTPVTVKTAVNRAMPNSAPATAPNSSSSPTRPAWSAPESGRGDRPARSHTFTTPYSSSVRDTHGHRGKAGEAT
ncbi:helix-turn-helix domain-containing protein [Streptomyces canus]|uniref:helix-turn-helix domain-containing protein n=1 Tax=Streptomyces canus TaxID=58343 RepID=UPI00277FF4A4|nr:helix-turn-helix transcriptional regulator [Streptomyces canus]MDQ0758340.1 hypothetical protein [Streptomyces canus]